MLKPEVVEAIFNNWSLGDSLLYPVEVETTGQFQLLPAKYIMEFLINSTGQSISVPAISNIN